MILRDIRDRIWAAADYAPAGSPEGFVRTREFINRALMRIALDAPFLFEEDVVLYLDPDIVDESTTDTPDVWRSPSGVDFDPWVLETAYDDSTAEGLILIQRFTLADRPINGRWIEYKDPADANGQRIMRHRIRDLWTVGEEGSQSVRISLYEPVQYTAPGFAPAGAGGPGVLSDWRITMLQHALPPGVVEVESIQVYDSNDNFVDFKYISAGEAVQFGYDASYWNSPTASHPWVYWPGEVESLPGLTPAPLAFAASVDVWGTASTDEPRGKFEYCYTLSLGQRHDEVQDVNPLNNTSTSANESGRRMPYLESPPTAYTDLIDPDDKEINIQAPNLNVLYGFGDSSTTRYNHTGLYVNLYRRRVENGTPPSGVSYVGYPTSNHFQHLASSAVGTAATAFIDDGSRVPGRKLRRVGGYKTLRFSPTTDKRYRVQLRCVVRPYEMLDDSDSSNIPPSAIDALIFLTLKNLYEAGGNPSMSANSYADYERALLALKKRHASLKPAGEMWRMSTRTSRRRGRRYRHNDIVETP